MSGPIVRTGTNPKFWANYDNIFGNKSGGAKAEKKEAAPAKKATKAAKAEPKAAKKAAKKVAKKATKKK